MHMARIAAAVALTFCVSAALSAQTWRTVESSRQLRDSAEHRVQVRYGAGRIDVVATDAPLLYSMNLRYDETATTPIHRYDAQARALTLGVDNERMRFSHNIDEKTKGEMRLALSRSVPLDLSLDLGATRGVFDLGGLSVRSLRLDSGASDLQLDFSTPNKSRMRVFDVDVGAASFEARNLANANAPAIRVHSGVGSVDLDFGGTWTQDMSVAVDLALGKITFRIPRDVGVRVEVEKFLAAFDQQGLQKRGDAYYSDNWDRAKYHLQLRAQTTIGGIEIDRGA
jgi:hypothetical protein